MFLLNLRTWKQNQFVRSNYSRDSIEELENAPTEIASNESALNEIEWKLRQVAWSKARAAYPQCEERYRRIPRPTDGLPINDHLSPALRNGGGLEVLSSRVQLSPYHVG
jgi:hypothetical protein